MQLYNSLTRQKEDFIPIHDDQVGLYTCGMTVYDYAHLGHGRKYVNDDILRRTLQYLGYQVNHVQNVTDVGHLVSDGDEGEDKLEKGARKHGKTVWEVAEHFTKDFYESMDLLNIQRPDIICKATDHIPEQIEMVKQLMTNGYAYDTEEAVYYDVTKFKNYGQMFRQKLEDKKTAVRKEVRSGEHKKNSADFVLWFKRVHRFADHVMYWESPWGDGFPGWHVECSAMSMKYLGEQFDIHTGGIEHLPIHHPNEIAQSEGVTGKAPFVKYWVHSNHLLFEGQKMSKSLGNVYRVQEVINEGYDPMALRYFYFSAHYRRELNFTWQALKGAQTALNKLRDWVAKAKFSSESLALKQSRRTKLSPEKLAQVQQWQQKFTDRVSDDFDMPGAIATVWNMLKDNIPDYDKADLLLDWDQILGLNLAQITNYKLQITNEVKDLIKQRDQARADKNFQLADQLRHQIENQGFTVEDTPSGTKVQQYPRV